MFKNDHAYFCKDVTKEDAWLLLENYKNCSSGEKNINYQKIFNNMKQRVTGNYMNPIHHFLKATQNLPDREMSGFIVMGVNCILIELYYEIIHGFPSSQVKFLDDGSITHTSICHAYEEVLPLLDATLSNPDSIHLSRIFYKGIRCGIIHQGQTKEKTAITFEDNCIIQENGGYYLCNPEFLFHELNKLYKELWVKLGNIRHDNDGAQKLIKKYRYILEDFYPAAVSEQSGI